MEKKYKLREEVKQHFPEMIHDFHREELWWISKYTDTPSIKDMSALEEVKEEKIKLRLDASYNGVKGEYYNLIHIQGGGCFSLEEMQDIEYFLNTFGSKEKMLEKVEGFINYVSALTWADQYNRTHFENWLTENK